MTYLAFGKDDCIVVPAMAPKFSVLGEAVCYTHPNHETFYSHYGFAYPINPYGIPFDYILDKKFDIESENVQHFFPNRRYILVDHQGKVWRVLLQQSDKGEMLITYAAIHNSGQGWWMTDSDLRQDVDEDKPQKTEDRNFIIGFLHTDPTPKKVKSFWKRMRMGEELDWFSIKDIVKRLNEEFPKKEKPINAKQLADEVFS